MDLCLDDGTGKIAEQQNHFLKNFFLWNKKSARRKVFSWLCVWKMEWDEIAVVLEAMLRVTRILCYYYKSGKESCTRQCKGTLFSLYLIIIIIIFVVIVIKRRRRRKFSPFSTKQKSRDLSRKKKKAAGLFFFFRCSLWEYVVLFFFGWVHEKGEENLFSHENEMPFGLISGDLGEFYHPLERG